MVLENYLCYYPLIMHFHFFPSLFEHPDKISFEYQEQNEKIELFLRQHWVVNVPWVVASITAFFVPAIIIQLDQFLGINFLINIPVQEFSGGLIIWYMIVTAFIIENFLSWYFNIYIVTNIHLVDINFRSLIAREVTEIELKDVQSQSAHRKGIWGALFDYGDVFVETAAERQRIEFRNIPNPDFVADRIQDLGEGNI